MSDEVKESMTPQEAEDVAAFLMLRRTGKGFFIGKTGDSWCLNMFAKCNLFDSTDDNMMKAVQKLAAKLPDVFDPAKGE